MARTVTEQQVDHAGRPRPQRGGHEGEELTAVERHRYAVLAAIALIEKSWAFSARTALSLNGSPFRSPTFMSYLKASATKKRSSLNHWLPRLLPGDFHGHVTASFVSSPQSVRALPGPVRSGVVLSFVHSLHTVFLVGIPVAVAAFVLTTFLRDLPLRRQSHIGMEETVAVPAAAHDLDEVLVVPEGAGSRS